MADTKQPYSMETIEVLGVTYIASLRFANDEYHDIVEHQLSNLERLLGIDAKEGDK